MSTEIQNMLSAAGSSAQYDENAKRLLGNKYILAYILKASVEEFVAKRPEESLKTQYMRMNFIHDFAVFVNECGGAAYVYPAEKM